MWQISIMLTSLEGLLRELFFRAQSWHKILIGALMCTVLLGFGYLRNLAKLASSSAELELPEFHFDSRFVKQTFAALPTGAFYFLTPLFLGYGIDNLLQLILLDFISPIVWGLAWILALTLSSLALVVVEDDPERLFLGLEFEKVLPQWWKLRRHWILPALSCYGLIALGGIYLFGASYFLGASLMVCHLSLTIRNLRYT